MTTSSAILLIDLSAIAHQAWHASTTDADPNATSTKTVARVRSLSSGQPHVAICCDHPPYHRKSLDPTYKAQRPSNEPLNHQVRIAQDTLRADGLPVWSFPGYEADDVIASAVRLAGQPVVIATNDKDLAQLVSAFVSLRALKDDAVIDVAGVVAKWGVRPDQMGDYLSLVGDSADNIKGAATIGPVKAAALLTKYQTLEGVYTALDAHGTDFTPALATSLREFQSRLVTVRALVALASDVPVPMEQLFTERVPADVVAFMEDDMLDVAPDEVTITTHPPILDRPAAPVALTVIEPDALQAPAEWERQLDPRCLKDAIALAKHVFESRLFSAYGTPQGVLTTIMAGRELGMPAMHALRAFHIVDGRPTLAADTIRAMVMRSGKATYFRCTERTAKHATFVTKRDDDPEVTLTFTIDEGRTAWPKSDDAWAASGWGKNPADMLVARASSKLARLVYPDVLRGLYDLHEVPDAGE